MNMPFHRNGYFEFDGHSLTVWYGFKEEECESEQTDE